MNPYVIGAACAGTVLMLMYAHHTGYQAAQADMARKVAAAQASTAAQEQRAREQTKRQATVWESERNELQGQVVDLLARGVTVRVCKPTGTAAVSPSTGPATRIDDGAGSSLDRLPDEQNVGPELVRLAGECEGYRRQLTALQVWVASQFVNTSESQGWSRSPTEQ